MRLIVYPAESHTGFDMTAVSLLAFQEMTRGLAYLVTSERDRMLVEVEPEHYETVMLCAETVNCHAELLPERPPKGTSNAPNP